jgi:putative lipoprotein
MKRTFVAGMAVALCIAGSPRHAAAAAPQSSVLGPAAAIVSGTVSYRERAELPSMAVVHLELIDVSGKDARTSVLGEQHIWTAWVPFPVDFRIEYDPLRIDPRHVYIVRARILEGEKLLFMNTTPYYVLTQGAPSKVNIIVSPARNALTTRP